MKRLLLLFLLLPALAFAETITIESVSVENPHIYVTYTEDVFVLSASLTGMDPGNDVLYTLRQVPEKDAGNPSYITEYEFFSGTLEDPQYLLDGRYLLTLEAITAEGLGTHDIVDFSVHGLQIRLIEPPFGFAKTNTYDVYFGTFIDNVLMSTTCRWSSTGFHEWGAMTSLGTDTDYTIQGLNYNGYLYVVCREPSGRETSKRFTVGFDTTPPEITAVANPALVKDPRDKGTFILVETNEDTVCTLDDEVFSGEDAQDETSYAQVHDMRISYEDITDTAAHSFTYDISCTDIAGWTQNAAVDVIVNFGLLGNIVVLSPAQITNTNTFTLRVRLSYEAETCTVNDAPMEQDGDTFTADFQNVENGDIPFSIRCVGEKDETLVHTVTVDTIPPVMTHLNASHVLCGNTIGAVFNATDNRNVLSYTYKVTDDIGLIAFNTTVKESAEIVISRPIVGTLHWEVYATDVADNNSSLAFADIPDFREGADHECGLPPFISLAEPPLGFALTSPYTVKLATTRQAACRYALQPGIPWESRVPFAAAGNQHTKVFNHPDQELYVWCMEPTGKNHTKTFRIGYDSTPPLIAIEAVPNPVIDPTQKVVVMTVRTSDSTYCEYNGEPFSGAITDPAAYKEEHVTTLDFRDVTTTNQQTRPYTIMCKNLAGLQNTEIYLVSINLGPGLQVELLEPGPFTAADPVPLKLRVNFDAACTWSAPDGTPQPFTVQDGVHSAILGSLDEGTHQYTIDCLSATERGTTLVSFIVDRSVPEITDLSGPDEICDSADYRYNISGLDGHVTIEYTLEGPSAVVFATNTTDALITIDATGIIPGTYTLTLTSINRAGTRGPSVDTLLEILSTEDCAATQCTNGILDPGEEQIDCGGTCVACTNCTTNAQCAPNICNDGVCVQAHLCDNNILDPTEEYIDCGGICDDCFSCIVDTECALDQACQANICVPLAGPSFCDNHIQDPNEEGVDCGGACPVCAPCITDLDCGFDICEDGLCAPAPRDPIDPIDENPTSIDGCTSDFECAVDKKCVASSCVARQRGTSPQERPGTAPVDERISWLALVLVILGVLIMGGAGYFLYEQNEEKNFPLPDTQQPMQTKFTQPGVQPPQQSVQQAAQTRAEEQKQWKDRITKRHKLFNVFGGKLPKKESEPKKEKPVPKKKDGDVFDELEKL